MNFHFLVSVRRRGDFVLDVDETCTAQALGIVGPSGSGKSTLLDAVAGILPGGRITLDGRDISGLRLEMRNVGYVMQDPLLFPHLTVKENLTYSPRAGDISSLTDALGIGRLLDRMPLELSGGERRRVSLARAIASRPQLLLLDEPFAGLDELRRREAMALLDWVKRELGLPMILVSHVADEVIGLTDWTLRLDAGRVMSRGLSESVLEPSETRIDNYFTGLVIADGRVRVGNVEMTVLHPAGASGRVRFACYANDIVLATQVPHDLSARNLFETKIVSQTKAGRLLLIHLQDPALRVLVTPEAAGTLGLEAGRNVFAILKSSSIVYLGPA